MATARSTRAPTPAIGWPVYSARIWAIDAGPHRPFSACWNQYSVSERGST